MSTRLTLRVTFLDDVHLGAGRGLGEVLDTIILRDSDGVPRLSGTELAGTLRQSLYLLLQEEPELWRWRLCEQSEIGRNGRSSCAASLPPAERCPLCRIFGTTDAPLGGWEVRSARPSQAGTEADSAYTIAGEAEMPAPIGGQGYGWRAGREGSTRVARTSVDPRTRRAQEDHLFVQEYGDAGLVFSTRWETVRPAAEALDEAAMLYAAARLTPAIGAHKSRGAGRCEIELEGSVQADGAEISKADLLQRFAGAWLRGDLQSSAGTPSGGEFPATARARPASAPVVESTSLRRVTLVFETLEPLVVARRPQAGNDYLSASLIPAQTLWGALAAKAAARSGVVPVALQNGSARVTPAYPARPAGGRRLLAAIPAPLDLLSCKAMGVWDPGSGHGIARASSQRAIEPYCPRCKADGADVALLQARGFVPVLGGSSFSIRPSSEVHLAIDPARGAGRQGDLYSYTALPRGTLLVAEIEGDPGGVAALLHALDLAQDRPGRMQLGKRVSRGYGECTVQVIENPGRSVFCPTPLNQRVARDAIEKKQPITLTLLTPLIEMDWWGRYRTGIDAALLSSLLGLQGNHSPLEILGSFCASSIVYGFNRTAGLPRWGDVAVSEGSAISFHWNGGYDDLLPRLERAESNRHGLRVNEGFGMLAFNHPVYSVAPIPQGAAAAIDRSTAAVPASVRDAWYWA
ncbi:MAG: RAMP superfamily CRISPR-associated protein, partial [Dehalococcoidia bacterium]